jgi:hypothetical protein
MAHEMGGQRGSGRIVAVIAVLATLATVAFVVGGGLAAAAGPLAELFGQMFGVDPEIFSAAGEFLGQLLKAL